MSLTNNSMDQCMKNINDDVNAFIQSNIATGIISAKRANTIRDSMIMGYKLLLNIPDAKNPNAENPNAENPNAENPNAENLNA